MIKELSNQINKLTNLKTIQFKYKSGDQNAFITSFFASESIPITLPRTPITIPPSTHLDDFARTMSGDDALPEGKVTFVVGPEKVRFPHLSKNLLCVRSEYFMKLFSNGMGESSETTGGENVVSVPDAQPNAFKTLISYIVTDKVSFEG